MCDERRCVCCQAMPASRAKGNQRCSQKSKRGKRKEKPPETYITLILMAITESVNQRCTLNEIYMYLWQRFEFFRGTYIGWKNSIRHNLSINEIFVKVPKEHGQPPKGHYWTINHKKMHMFENRFSKRRTRVPRRKSAQSYLHHVPLKPQEACLQEADPATAYQVSFVSFVKENNQNMMHALTFYRIYKLEYIRTFSNFSMDCIEKQRVCIGFCFKLGKTASESFKILKKAFKEDAYHNRGHLNGLHD
ncbi:FOXF1 [Cordylochernes scorpioides]|uniref:FOXF1 n=1 Tax=Cordylochernes scorpioides TaxID=51811 RepID=A0ABY6LT36_9ARAC|nr:FOXF1 [Cordylochernes scorpioides]